MDAKPRIEQRYRIRIRNKFESGGVLYVMDGLDKDASDYNDIVAIGRRFSGLSLERNTTRNALTLGLGTNYMNTRVSLARGAKGN